MESSWCDSKTVWLEGKCNLKVLCMCSGVDDRVASIDDLSLNDEGNENDCGQDNGSVDVEE